MTKVDLNWIPLTPTIVGNYPCIDFYMISRDSRSSLHLLAQTSRKIYTAMVMHKIPSTWNCQVSFVQIQTQVFHLDLVCKIFLNSHVTPKSHLYSLFLTFFTPTSFTNSSWSHMWRLFFTCDNECYLHSAQYYFLFTNAKILYIAINKCYYRWKVFGSARNLALECFDTSKESRTL